MKNNTVKLDVETYNNLWGQHKELEKLHRELKDGNILVEEYDLNSYSVFKKFYTNDKIVESLINDNKSLVDEIDKLKLENKSFSDEIDKLKSKNDNQFRGITGSTSTLIFGDNYDQFDVEEQKSIIEKIKTKFFSIKKWIKDVIANKFI